MEPDEIDFDRIAEQIRERPETVELDPIRAREAADAGIEQSYGAAPEEWREEARRAVRKLALEHQEFTTDDLWRDGLSRPPNSARALGGVMRWAVKWGICEKTGRAIVTEQVKSHGSPKHVWRSLIYVEEQA